jgi:hypothetical protein
VIAVSLGTNCQVAHQIRRITGQREAFFFDWIVTEHDALLRSAALQFQALLAPKNLQLATNGKSVLDAATGLRFYLHDFPSTNGMIDPDRLEENASVVREKYLRRAGRTRSLLACGEPVLLVRYLVGQPADVCAQQRDDITRAFRHHYPEVNVRFLWVTDSPDVAAALGIHCAPPSPLGWTGDDVAWDMALASVTCGLV